MLGPFPSTDHLPHLHISRFGVIPKGHNTGKFRLITDLSSPTGRSVNDGIDSELCSLVYTKVDEVVAQAAVRGRGALLAKVDIEAAYRLIPVHPQDRILQAVQWRGNTFCESDAALRIAICPENFQCGSRRSSVAPHSGRYRGSVPLPR